MKQVENRQNTGYCSAGLRKEEIRVIDVYLHLY